MISADAKAVAKLAAETIGGRVAGGMQLLKRHGAYDPRTSAGAYLTCLDTMTTSLAQDAATFGRVALGERDAELTSAVMQLAAALGMGSTGRVQ